MANESSHFRADPIVAMYESWRHENPNSLRSQASAAMRRTGGDKIKIHTTAWDQKESHNDHLEAVKYLHSLPSVIKLKSHTNDNYTSGMLVRSKHRDELNQQLAKGGYKHSGPTATHLGHSYTKGKNTVSVSSKPDIHGYYSVSVSTKRG